MVCEPRLISSVSLAASPAWHWLPPAKQEPLLCQIQIFSVKKYQAKTGQEWKYGVRLVLFLQNDVISLSPCAEAGLSVFKEAKEEKERRPSKLVFLHVESSINCNAEWPKTTFILLLKLICVCVFSAPFTQCFHKDAIKKWIRHYYL